MLTIRPIYMIQKVRNCQFIFLDQEEGVSRNIPVVSMWLSFRRTNGTATGMPERKLSISTCTCDVNREDVNRSCSAGREEKPHTYYRVVLFFMQWLLNWLVQTPPAGADEIDVSSLVNSINDSPRHSVGPIQHRF